MDSDLQKRFEDGIRKFNEGKFYECHDVLEDVWFDVRGRSRKFYQGLIHLAVGFYHLTHRNNLKGTISQLNKGISKLSEYEPEFQGVELKRLLDGVRKCLEEIQRLKDSKSEGFDYSPIPKIKFIPKGHKDFSEQDL
jgi:predicted metal-dependent hydrolase